MASVNEQPVQYSKTRVGLMLGAIIMLTLFTGFGGFKFVPMQGAIMEFFNIKESAYGYLNTCASWISVACSIPFAFLVRKLRCNITVGIGMLVAVGGIFIQSFCTNFIVMIIGRMIEGTGQAFAFLATGSLTLNLVDKSKVAFWSSIMIIMAVIPQVIMTKGGTALMVNSGLSFQQVFRLIAYVYLVAIVLWMILVPFSLRATGIGSNAKPTREQNIRVLKNKSNWYVAIANMLFALPSVTFTSYIIMYLTMKGLTPTKAADMYSYTTLLGIAAMLAFGIISTKLKTKRKIAILSFFSGAVALVLLVAVPANMIWIYILIWGTLPRSIAGMAQASSADVAEIPADIPVINSIKSTVQQIGTIVFGILLGYLIQYLGYDFSIFVMAGCMVIGGILWILAKKIP